MKNAFILSFALLISFQLKSQVINMPRNNETGKIEYSEIVLVDTATSQMDLFIKAKEWIALNFRSATNVIQMEDKDAGILIGKGNFEIKLTMYLTYSRVDFTFKIQVKNGKYRYWISDFVHVSNKQGYSGGALENERPDCGTFNMMKKGWNQVKEQTDENIKLLIESLKKEMSLKTSSNNNW